MTGRVGGDKGSEGGMGSLVSIYSATLTPRTHLITNLDGGQTFKLEIFNMNRDWLGYGLNAVDNSLQLYWSVRYGLMC